MSYSNPALVALTFAFVAMAAPSTDAHAVEFRNFIQNATGICQAATKAGSGIRNRPKAVQNEGGSPAFVSCSFASQGSYAPHAENPYGLWIYASVNDGVADTVSCSAVLGYASDGFQYPAVVKTAVLPATGEEIELSWQPEDFGVTAPVPPSDMLTLPSGLLNVSCALNQGVGINDTYVYFVEATDS